jgi:aspartyl-tRNA synthetase
VVRTRPDSQRNSDMATGAIEVFAHELTIINRAEPLPWTSTRSTAKR